MGPARTGLLILVVFVACGSAQNFNFGNELQFGHSPRVCRELHELGLAGVHPIHLGALTGGRKLQRNGVESSRVWTWLGNHGGRGLWGGTLGSHPWLSPAHARYGGRWGVLRTGAWVIHGGRRLWIPLPMYGFGHTVGLSTRVRIDRRVTSGLKTGIPQGHVGPVGRFEHMGPNFGPGLEGRWGFPGLRMRGGRRGRIGQTGPWGPVQGGPGMDEAFFSWEQNQQGGGPWGGMNQGSRGLGASGGQGLGGSMRSDSANAREGSSGSGGQGVGSSSGNEFDLGIGASGQGQQGAQGSASGTRAQGGLSGSAQGGTDEGTGSGFLSGFSSQDGSWGLGQGSGGGLGGSSGGSGLSGLEGMELGGIGGMESLGGLGSWGTRRRRRGGRRRYGSIRGGGGSFGMGGLGQGGRSSFGNGLESGGSSGTGGLFGGSSGFEGGLGGGSFGAGGLSGSGIAGFGSRLGSGSSWGEGSLSGGGEDMQSGGGLFGRGFQQEGGFGLGGSRWSRGDDLSGSFGDDSLSLAGQFGDEMGGRNFGFGGIGGEQFGGSAGYGGLYSGLMRRGIGGLGRGSGYGSFWSSQGAGSGSPFVWRVIRYSAPQHRRPSGRWIVWSSTPQGGGGFNYGDLGGGSSSFFGGSGGGLSGNFGSSSFSDESSGSSRLKLSR